MVGAPTKIERRQSKRSIPTAKSDSYALALLTAGAESHGRVASLEGTLDWRYLSKANLSFRPTSVQGQKALEAALRTAQGMLTIDGRKRVK